MFSQFRKRAFFGVISEHPFQLHPSDDMNLSQLESLTHSTVRIACHYKDGSQGTGTGFFFNFSTQADSTPIVAVITNKHVIKDALYGNMLLRKADVDDSVSKQSVNVRFIDPEVNWLMHPDPDVDLCLYPLNRAIRAMSSNGEKLFLSTLNLGLINNDLAFDAIEDVLMIGYPNGLWDDVNNMPIVRKGVTATHVEIDYRGKKEFVIDAACFPGSSGSPVFIVKSGVFSDKFGQSMVASGSLLRFVGVLYAGPQVNVTGEIMVVDIPTSQKAVSVSQVMMNLGYIIKSERVLELGEILRRG
jgi:V8-like Glu-specific endopeptidase